MPLTPKVVTVETLGEPRFVSPLPLAERPGTGQGCFVPDGTLIRGTVELPPEPCDGEELLFEKAGPRRRIFFDPARTRAAVVTCGGLCPGLNNVIRSLFLELRLNYGVAEVIGIRAGYAGLNPAVGPPPVVLTLEMVSDIHKDGGTILASSRGMQPAGAIVDFLERERIDLLFCIGGDGTLRGAHDISKEVRRRGLEIAVVGIPKTIDNDIEFCDRTFGFFTAIEMGREVIHGAHAEAKGARRGIGLVKLMGRDAGFIACGATLASQEVNFTLIPEAPFALDGEDGFLAALDRRMDARGHAVVVVAEGAGQDLFPGESLGADASGNRLYHDIGPFLKQQIVEYFRGRGKPVAVKYIDPSYIVRSVAANCDDSLLCDHLARRAAHAAMAGRTDLMVGFLNYAFLHVPLPLATAGKRTVDVEGRLWAAVLATTGQPAHLGAGVRVASPLPESSPPRASARSSIP